MGNKLRALSVFVLCLLLMSLASGCETDNANERAANEIAKQFQGRELIGNYFTTVYEGGDSFHVLQFNLYLASPGKIEGYYYELFALFNPIPDEVIHSHLKEMKSIGPDIFSTIKPHVGIIKQGSITKKTITFETGAIAYDDEHRTAWKFHGSDRRGFLKGVLTMRYTPVYDEQSATHVEGIGKVQTTKRVITLERLTPVKSSK